MNLIHCAYEPAGPGPHPAVVALHGWGASSLDLIGLAPYLAGGQFLVLCPQGRTVVPLGPSEGYGWFPITMGASPDPQAFAAGVADARAFVDTAVRRYPVDPAKVVLLGFSQGGVIAYALALSDPQHFTALVALSSWLPEPVAQTLPQVSRDHLATLVHHGTTDEMIPVERGRESIETLRRLKVPVSYRELDMGHEINAASLADLSQWLRDKVLSPIIL